ncbi:hypothetical protein OH492_16685 [Vibrio chagasii]|nr:hypothetical protein [Vibrio chagasii]
MSYNAALSNRQLRRHEKEKICAGYPPQGFLLVICELRHDFESRKNCRLSRVLEAGGYPNIGKRHLATRALVLNEGTMPLFLGTVSQTPTITSPTGLDRHQCLRP